MMTQDQAHQTIDQLADSAHDLVDRILSGVGRAEGSAPSAQAFSPDQTEQFMEALTVFVREHPFAATAAALAAGYAVSRIL